MFIPLSNLEYQRSSWEKRQITVHWGKLSTHKVKKLFGGTTRNKMRIF